MLELLRRARSQRRAGHHPTRRDRLARCHAGEHVGRRFGALDESDRVHAAEKPPAVAAPDADHLAAAARKRDGEHLAHDRPSRAVRGLRAAAAARRRDAADERPVARRAWRGAAVRSREENRERSVVTPGATGLPRAPEGDVGGAVGHECVGAGRDVPGRARDEILGLRSRCAAARGDAHPRAGDRDADLQAAALAGDRSGGGAGRQDEPHRKGCDHGPADHSALRNQAEDKSARDEQQHGAEAGDDGGDLHAAPLAPEARAELAVHLIEVRRGRRLEEAAPRRLCDAAERLRVHDGTVTTCLRPPEGHFDRGVARTEGDRRDRHLQLRGPPCGIERVLAAVLRPVGAAGSKRVSPAWPVPPPTPAAAPRATASERSRRRSRSPCRDAAARAQPRGVAIGGGGSTTSALVEKETIATRKRSGTCRGMSPPTCAPPIRLGWTSLASIEREVSMTSTTVASSWARSGPRAVVPARRR